MKKPTRRRVKKWSSRLDYIWKRSKYRGNRWTLNEIDKVRDLVEAVVRHDLRISGRYGFWRRFSAQLACAVLGSSSEKFRQLAIAAGNATQVFSLFSDSMAEFTNSELGEPWE